MKVIVLLDTGGAIIPANLAEEVNLDIGNFRPEFGKLGDVSMSVEK